MSGRRGLGLSLRISGFFALLVLVSVLVVGALSYLRIVDESVEPLLGRRLDYTARGIAVRLPGERHEALRKALETGGPEAVRALPEFKELHRVLVLSQRQNELTEPVRTLVRDPKEPSRLVALLSSEEDGAIGAPAEPDAAVEAVFAEGLPSFTRLYSRGGLQWVSGFSPIETSKGDLVGVVRVDYPADEELAAAKLEVLRTLGIAGAIGFALATLAGAAVGRGIAGPVERLSAAAEEATQGNLDPRIEVKASGEIGVLAGAFRQMLAEIRRSRAELEDYSRTLEAKVASRTAELRAANQKTTAMLDSLGQGFFLFGRDGRCLPFHSRACGELLEGVPVDRDVAAYLKADPGAVSGWLPLLFEEPIPFADPAALGPKAFPHSKGRQIDLAYQPVRDEAGRVELVIAIATDRTRERAAEREAGEEKAFSKLVVAVAESRERFLAFVREARGMLATLASDPAQALRALHTIKGGAGLFHLRELAERAHDWETKVGAGDGSAERAAGELAGLIDRSLAKLSPLLGDDPESGEQNLVHSRSELLSLVSFLKAQGLQPPAVLRATEALICEPIEQGFRHFDAVVARSAEKLGKRVAPLGLEGGSRRVDLPRLEGLIASMVHAFRNAVDHGIEPPDERRAAGKPEEGRIVVRFAADAARGRLAIEVEDDGRGIDPERIRRRLLSRDPAHPMAALADDEVIQAVFESGFSTRDEVTELSGRGVGMDAIRHEARRLGGDVRVRSATGRGSVLRVEVPIA